MGSMMYNVVYVVLLCLSRAAAAAAASASPQIFSVLSYGAVGDGAGDDTRPFRSAWEAACQADHPAVLLIPRHYTITIQSTYLRGPCKNPLTFQIEGNLTSLEGPGSWPEKFSKQMWVVFYRIKGMTMQGGGVIDGRGHQWWDLPCKPRRGVNRSPGDDDDPCDSPTAMRFIKCTNLVVQGFKMTNSPKFHFRFDKCRHVRVDSLRIYSPANSPNTDGIHLGDSSNISIYNSVIATGDDCVSIGAGTFNVDIRNISCDHTHGISIGSLGWNETRPARVSNVTVRDSVIKRSDSGLRIKTWQGGYGAVSNVSFANIAMDNVRYPIIIDQFYCIRVPGSGRGPAACSNRTSAVRITGISYTNIKGTYDTAAPPVLLACSDTVPCTNLVVSDVELLPAQQGMRTVDPFCWNAYGYVTGAAAVVPPLLCLNRTLQPPVNEDDIVVGRCRDVWCLLRLTASSTVGFWIITYLCSVYILVFHLRVIDYMGVLRRQLAIFK